MLLPMADGIAKGLVNILSPVSPVIEKILDYIWKNRMRNLHSHDFEIFLFGRKVLLKFVGLIFPGGTVDIIKIPEPPFD